MVIRRRFIYLYLALTCFVGFIIVFFIDGYKGVYDTLYITAGEREKKVELYQWLRRDGAWSAPARWGEKAFFRYEIDNREFSIYSADIEVSLWHEQKEVRYLISQHMQIARFDKGRLEWALDTTELEPAGAPPGRGASFGHPDERQIHRYLIVIKGDGIERRLEFNIYSHS